jgi:hypothetical protein
MKNSSIIKVAPYKFILSNRIVMWRKVLKLLLLPKNQLTIEVPTVGGLNRLLDEFCELIKLLK